MLIALKKKTSIFFYIKLYVITGSNSTKGRGLNNCFFCIAHATGQQTIMTLPTSSCVERLGVARSVSPKGFRFS